MGVKRRSPGQPFIMGDDVLVVERPREGRQARVRAFKVIVDASEVGQVRAGGSLRVPVAPGGHTVSVKVDWTGSRAHEVVVHRETVVTVRLKGNVLSRQGYLQVVDGIDEPTRSQINRAFAIQMLTGIAPVLAVCVLLLFATALL